MVGGGEAGLRARKKLQTHRALATAARELALEGAMEDVTVDAIAERAGVSPRTFFNYFASRDDAIVGTDAAIPQRLAEELLGRPADEPPVVALRAVLLGDDDEISETAHRWALRSELLRRHPALLPRFLAGLVEIERALTDALGERLGVDPDEDAYPELVVSAVVATLRAALAWWDRTGRHQPLEEAAASALDTLALGFDRAATPGAPRD